MAGRKIIEDSDEEDHDDIKSPSKVATDVSPASRLMDADLSSLPSSKNLPNHDEPSTGSTERLSRDIREACSNLIEHTPDERKSMAKPLRSSQQLPVSPETLQLKSRRATTAFPERKDQRIMKKYGSKGSQDTEFHSSSNLALEYTPTRKSQFIGESKLSQENDTYEMAKKLHLEVSRCNDLGKHKAASCRNLELNDVEQNLKSIEKVGSAQLLESPNPLSLLKSAGCDHNKHSESSTMPLSTEEQKTMLAKSTSIVTSAIIDTKSSTDRMPSPTLSSRSLNDVTNPFSLDENSTQSRKRAFSQIDLPNLPLERPNKLVRIEERPASPIPGEEKIDQDTNDELSLSVLIPMPSITKTKPPKSRKMETNERASNDELGSDEISYDLPAEHYQPRPSRSRSGLVDDKLLVPADFSKRPESVAKRQRKKRRKTTAFEQLIYDENNEDNEDEIAEIAQSFREEKFHQEPAMETVNDLKLSDNPHMEASEPDSMAKASSPKKRGRPKKQITEVPSKPPTEHIPKPHEPKKSKAAIPPKASKPKDPLPPLSNPSSDTENSAPEEEEEEEEANLSTILTEKKHPNNNTVFPPPPTPNLQTNPPSSPTKPQKIPLPPQTPQKSSSTTVATTTTMTAKGPDKHSPLSSGKVAYRVGLSKRARIEPLLRMVRK